MCRGIDPIINAILNYSPTADDETTFVKQIEHIESVINKYWPKDNNWDILYNDNEEEKEKEKEEKTKLVKLTSKQFEETVRSVSEDFSIVLEKVQ